MQRVQSRSPFLRHSMTTVVESPTERHTPPRAYAVASPGRFHATLQTQQAASLLRLLSQPAWNDVVGWSFGVGIGYGEFMKSNPN